MKGLPTRGRSPYDYINPILDTGAPTSTGGTKEASAMCQILGIDFELSPPRAVYEHGWGVGCDRAKRIRYTWYLTLFDTQGLPTTIPFDLVEGHSPLVIGLDVEKYGTINNVQNYTEFKRPNDNAKRKLLTYVDTDDNGDERIWLDIAPHRKSSVTSLMANVKKRPELNLVKKVHRFTHGNRHELSTLFEDAGMMTDKVKKAIDKVTSSCIPCTKSGRPANSTKISLKHVNKDFNAEVQADFLTVKCSRGKYEILNIIDTSTGYGERSVVKSRSAEVMKSKFEEYWICRHGSPGQFSADPEFCQPFFVKYLNGHSIEVNERPARSSHKNGRVERNNGLFKSVFGKLSKEKTDADIDLIVARASFVSNIIFGRSHLNSFQLARGYMPAIAGLPATILTQDMLDAHIQMSACRAIQRAATSRTPNNVPHLMIKPGDTIYVFYKSTNKSVNVEWITATVMEAKEHFVECRRSQKGRPMRVAYEHVRLMPSGDLAKEITEGSLEEFISETDTSTIKTIDDMTSHRNEDIYADIFGSDNESDEDDELQPIGTARAMLSTQVTGDPTKDIGVITERDTKQSKEPELTSTHQDTLNEIYDIVGSKQLTRSKMACAPSWLLDKALQEELSSNWSDTHDEVDERQIKRDANVIPSHVVYKIKNEENDVKRMKARLCPNGNRDKLKKTVRKDSATAQFDVIRLILSLATIFTFRIGCIDIKGAYLQSGPIRRSI